MSRYELSLNPNYVSHWSYWEALRELIQNAVDREVDDEKGCKFHVDYTSKENYLEITSNNTMLEKKTLLLGVTSKKGCKNYIGKYGEGYKLACLVLCRLGIRIEILSGNELWIPKIIKSKKYDSEILVFDISHRKKRSDHLTFRLSGITSQVYAEFTFNFLSLQYPENVIKTDCGTVLQDKSTKGKYTLQVYLFRIVKILTVFMVTIFLRIVSLLTVTAKRFLNLICFGLLL